VPEPERTTEEYERVAEAVHDAASALNRAMMEAAGIGLRVELETSDYQTVGQRYAMPVVSPSVTRPIARREP
jgi:hypothetical protein